MNQSELRDALCKAGAEGDAYGFPRGPYKIQQHADELMPLLMWLHDNIFHGARYLEIGCAAAGTARFLDARLAFSEVTLLDDGKHRDAELRPENVKRMRCPHIRQLVMSSHSGEARLALTGLKFDLILVDGDHSYEGCLKDLELACDHLADEGVVVVHDSVANQGVRDAISDFDFDAHGLTHVGHAHAGGKAPGTTWYRKDH